MRWKMDIRNLYVFVALTAVLYWLPTAKLAARNQQRLGPVQVVAKSFPGSVELKEAGRLIEFCPDGAGDGFVGPKGLPVPTLEDFAYLYIYYFSDYYDLPDWRKRPDAAKQAEEVLLRPEYGDCMKKVPRETARCILLHLSRDKKIKLIFVRYDEGRRNVVKEDIVKKLSQKGPAPRR
jgi:hypothetical protein